MIWIDIKMLATSRGKQSDTCIAVRSKGTSLIREHTMRDKTRYATNVQK